MSEDHERDELELPPEELDETSPETLDDVREAQPEPARPAQTVERAPAASPEELDKITDNLLEVVAEMGSTTLPLELQDAYIVQMTGNRMIRRGLVATGLPSALDELMPASGGGTGVAKQLHPVVRVVAGLAVLALGSIFTRNAVLSAANAPRQ